MGPPSGVRIVNGIRYETLGFPCAGPDGPLWNCGVYMAMPYAEVAAPTRNRQVGSAIRDIPDWFCSLGQGPVRRTQCAVLGGLCEARKGHAASDLGVCRRPLLWLAVSPCWVMPPISPARARAQVLIRPCLMLMHSGRLSTTPAPFLRHWPTTTKTPFRAQGRYMIAAAEPGWRLRQTAGIPCPRLRYLII